MNVKTKIKIRLKIEILYPPTASKALNKKDQKKQHLLLFFLKININFNRNASLVFSHTCDYFTDGHLFTYHTAAIFFLGGGFPRPQPWCNPLWLTGLKAPTNQLTSVAQGGGTMAWWAPWPFRCFSFQELLPYILRCCTLLEQVRQTIWPDEVMVQHRPYIPADKRPCMDTDDTLYGCLRVLHSTVWFTKATGLHSCVCRTCCSIRIISVKPVGEAVGGRGVAQ